MNTPFDTPDPNNTTAKQLMKTWPHVLALLVNKLTQGEHGKVVTITPEELRAYIGAKHRTNLGLRQGADGIHLWTIDNDEAERLQKKHVEKN